MNIIVYESAFCYLRGNTRAWLRTEHILMCELQKVDKCNMKKGCCVHRQQVQFVLLHLLLCLL